MGIELGDEVRCKVTGFKGIVIATIQCLTGCDRVTVQPPVNKDGKNMDAYNFDVAAVEIIKKNKVTTTDMQESGSKTKKGGPPTKAVL